jgi:16S rRNA processing protein RimM
MFVELGEIVNVVGLRGEVKLLLTGNFDERILRSEFLRLERPDGRVEEVHCRGQRSRKGNLIVALEEVRDRDEAETLVGGRLGFVAADYDDPRFPRDEGWPAFAYLGCEVVTSDGRRVGLVENVLTLPANWVLQVVGDERGLEEVLIPVIEDVIRERDRENRRVVIEAIPGLLDPEEDS